MIKTVIKNDGTQEAFDPDKLNKWAGYACKQGGDWSRIALNTYKKLPEVAKSEDIHQTMLDVCYAEATLEYSRIAARLEVAQLRKNIEREFGLKPNLNTWKEIYDTLLSNNVWCKDTIPPYSKAQEALYNEIKTTQLEAWQYAQWGDKYLMKVNNVVIETPHIAAMGIGLGLLGDNKQGHALVRNIIHSKVNLPTPVLNGIRDGNFDGISCCVIEADDNIESIGIANYIAYRMTAKKAGIGIRFNTRSKGAPVRGGIVEHLGKHSIYNSLDGSVKAMTQVTRGGSATVAFDVIDPEVRNIALWKSQRIDIENRLDKIDYSFTFNDAFLEAVVKRKKWYLFDYLLAPKVYEAFYSSTVEEYEKVVQEHLEAGVPHVEQDALDLLKHLLTIRQETGRLYCTNMSRANSHTPFEDEIRLSNLCQEIFLPTKPYQKMLDLEQGLNEGETAFCALAALVPVNISEEEYEAVMYNTVLAISTLIKRCPKMNESHNNTMLKRMSLGIGISGLAECLYKHGLDYDGSDESLEYVHDLVERHYFYALKASVRLAEETGEYVEGVTDWLPIDTKVSKYTPKMDWESLRGKKRHNSVLVSIQPCESSSLSSGTTNSVYPPRSKVVNKKSRKGVVQFICESYKPEVHLSAWDVPNITLSRYYGVIQDWTDQGISADTYLDPSQEKEGKKQMSDLIREWVAHFRLGNKSMYYVNTHDKNQGSIHDVEAEEDDCESCKL